MMSSDSGALYDVDSVVRVRNNSIMSELETRFGMCAIRCAQADLHEARVAISAMVELTTRTGLDS